MKNKKLYNYLPNLIISLFLAFIFLALSLLFAADNIFFEPTTYTNSMHKIKIEDTAFQEIQTYCEQQYASLNKFNLHRNLISNYSLTGSIFQMFSA